MAEIEAELIPSPHMARSINLMKTKITNILIDIIHKKLFLTKR